MTSKTPLITVLLCTYNDEAFIAETIQSILDQTYKNFEFIILNDGSTDGTKDIILSFGDDRIRYLEHDVNKGLEDAKNWGLDEAKGKYIAYIDGDDLSEPDRLRIQSQYMEAHPEVGICSTRKTLFGTKNNSPFHVEHDIKIRARALFGTPMEHPSCMIRAEVLRKHNIRYRKEFPVAEDFPFMIDMMEVSQAYCVPIPLIRKRIHDQRISFRKKQIADESAARASQMGFKVLLGIDAGAEERFAFKRCFFKKSEVDDIATLERLKNKIQIHDQLSDREMEFRKFVKDLIVSSISNLTSNNENTKNSSRSSQIAEGNKSTPRKSIFQTFLSKFKRIKTSNKRMPVLGIVITQKNESAILNYNIEYHRFLGITHFYIYDDGSSDNTMSLLPDEEGIHKYYGTDYSNIPPELENVKQKALRDHWMGRQILNTYHALQEAKKDNVDWLFFIDADELIYLGSTEANSFQSVFANIDSDIEVVHFSKVLEYAQTSREGSNIFRSGTFFKTVEYEKVGKRKIFDPIRDEMVTIKGLLGHNTGKQAARVSADLVPVTSHTYKRRNMELPLTLKLGIVVHYHGCSFEEFIKKNSLPHPTHFIFGGVVPYYPKLFWRDLVQKSGMNTEELRAYFEQWFIFSDEEISQLFNESEKGNPLIIEHTSVNEVWKNIDESKFMNKPVKS